MTTIIPDPNRIKSFRTEAAFEKWLSKNHDRATEIWLKVYKKNSGKASVTCAQALDVALCWGWIDGIRKTFDEHAFLQRYTPRKTRSVWSQINRNNVARLIAAGRMTEYGQKQVDVARADGRWEAAYAPMRNATAAGLPSDLLEAINVNARARKTLQTLNRQNLFALAFRTNSMRTSAGRVRKIKALVEMLARGEAIVPPKKQEGTASH